MREMNQGEVYREMDVDEDYDVEASEDTSSSITKIYGIPKNIFILIAAAVIVLLIAVIVIALRKNIGGSSSDDVVKPSSSTTQQTNSAIDSAVYVYSKCIGNTPDGLRVGAVVYAEDGTVVGTIDSVGDHPVTDIFGELIGYMSGINATPPATPEPVKYYDNTTVELLRKYGYTGDEIDEASKSNADVDALVEAAKALQDEAAKEAIARMMDTASDEYRQLINTTQYCMPYQEYVSVPWTTEGYVNRDGSYIVNADFEKIPTYGYQLRIKVKIANGTYVFMDVAPERYYEMPDSGNIVVRVDYTVYGCEPDDVQLYITSVTEKDITTLTVNPEDSAIDINDAIN